MNKIKVTLISSYSGTISNGLRVISSYLKTHGHEVDLIFLNIPQVKIADSVHKQVVNDLIDLCKSSDLIGFSLMTNQFLIVKELTTYMKEQLDIPIIWGGIHPTVAPDECLQYADIVCIGEGEEAMLELANKLALGDEITDIKNLYLKKNNQIIRNEVRELEENLDKYPFPDYDIQTHYMVVRGRRIMNMTEELLEKTTRTGYSSRLEYSLITTRGCPHNCTYCCNNALRKIYVKKGKFVRKRTPENVIEEIEYIKNKFTFIKQVWIMDDTFFVRSKEEMQAFCTSYQEKINLPLRCGASPLTIDEEKLKLMVEAGLFNIHIGIQSYADETLLKCYNRPTPKTSILEAVRIIEKYKSHITCPVYHIIVDNPYETKASRKETLDFVTSLPQEANVNLYSLVFYPGTELHERAMEDGIIKNKIDDIYTLYWTGDIDIKRTDYLSYLLSLYVKLKKSHTKLSIKKIIHILSRDKIIVLFDNKVFLFLISLFRRIKRTPTMMRRVFWEMRRFIKKAKKKGLKRAVIAMILRRDSSKMRTHTL